MLRKGSLPNVLPEDIKHRPQTPRTDTSRPPPPLRIPSHRTNNESCQTPPTPPRLIPHTTYQRRLSFAHPDSPSNVLEHRPLQDVVEAQTSEKLPPAMHILVVEDNLVNQKVLAKQLRNLGCIVNVANHGREALEFLERTKYWNRELTRSYPTSRRASYHIPCTEPPPSSHLEDSDVPLELSIICMDWEMPVMNGLEAVKRIRQLEMDGTLVGRVPVIGVTANVRQQQIETAIAAGMDDVVGKPFRVAELLTRMKGIVEVAVNEPCGIGLGIMG